MGFGSLVSGGAGARLQHSGGAGGSGASVTSPRQQHRTPPAAATTSNDVVAAERSRSADAGNSSSSDMHPITVSVRVRPINKREKAAGHHEAAWRWSGPSIVSTKRSSKGGTTAPQHLFTFDNVFPPATPTQTVYERVCKGVVEAAVRGYNCCAFAYGQTSTGKTHTMHGSAANPGVIPLAGRDVFALVDDTPDREFFLRVSYMEIYNECVNDLLNPEPSGKGLHIYEHPKRGVFVSGLTEEVVISADEVMARIKAGEELRHVGHTNFNAVSSRSHTVFRFIIESTSRKPVLVSATGSASTTPARRKADGLKGMKKQKKKQRKGGGLLVPNVKAGGRPRRSGTRLSTLNLVDLAGSENVRATGSKGKRRKEGGFINKSLLTLGHVISRLSEMATGSRGRGHTHIPYRDSKLTRILQPALNGNSRVSVVCTITPAAGSVEETQNTLKFGARAKRIKHIAVVNEVNDTDAVIQKYKNEVARLKEKLRRYEQQAALSNGAGPTSGSVDTPPPQPSGPLFSLYSPSRPDVAAVVNSGAAPSAVAAAALGRSPQAVGVGAGAGAGAGAMPVVYQPMLTRADGSLGPVASTGDEGEDVSVLRQAIANLSKLILNSNRTPARKRTFSRRSSKRSVSHRRRATASAAVMGAAAHSSRRLQFHHGRQPLPLQEEEQQQQQRQQQQPSLPRRATVTAGVFPSPASPDVNSAHPSAGGSGGSPDHVVSPSQRAQGGGQGGSGANGAGSGAPQSAGGAAKEALDIRHGVQPMLVVHGGGSVVPQVHDPVSASASTSASAAAAVPPSDTPTSGDPVVVSAKTPPTSPRTPIATTGRSTARASLPVSSEASGLLTAGSARSMRSHESWHEQTTSLLDSLQAAVHVMPSPSGSVSTTPTVETQGVEASGRGHASAHHRAARGTITPSPRRTHRESNATDSQDDAVYVGVSVFLARLVCLSRTDVGECAWCCVVLCGW